MKLSVLRSLSLLAFSTAALSAQAYVIQIAGTINSSNIVTGTTYRFSDLPELGSTFNYFFNVNGAGALTATFTQGGSSLSVLSIPGTTSLTLASGVYTYSGSYNVSAVTNVAIPPAGFTGTYSGNFDGPNGTFFLNLQSAVPGPAAVTPFLLGAVGAMRRRRKA